MNAGMDSRTEGAGSGDGAGDAAMPGKVVRAAVAALERRFADAGFAGSACFVIAGEGALRVDESGVRACPGGDCGPVEVTLSADRATFEALLSGATSPAGAFMSGRLRIDGDMGAAMRLGAALA